MRLLLIFLFISSTYDGLLASPLEDLAEGWESTGESLKRVDLMGDNRIIIHGDIKTGDLERIKKLITQSEGQVSRISITSNGGDALEAMEIGRFVNRHLLYVHPGEYCNSACALIFIASPVVGQFDFSSQSTTLGFHRPRFAEEHFSDLNSTEARNKYDKLTEMVTDYAVEMGMPQTLVDKMMATDSQDVVSISLAEYYSKAGRPAAIDEWLRAKCELLNKKERNDYLPALHYHYYAKEDFVSSKTLIQKGRSFSAQYRQYLINKRTKARECVRSSLDKERERLFEQRLKE
jgi:hypothetical protein